MDTFALPEFPGKEDRGFIPKAVALAAPLGPRAARSQREAKASAPPRYR